MRDPLLADGVPFRHVDAPTVGLDRRALGRLVSAGDLRRPFRGVYVDARVPDTRTARILCLRLVIPPYAVVWGRTAAWVWGLDVFAPSERELLVPECAVPHHWARMKHPGVRVVEAMLPARDVTEQAGVRLTTPPRTALDLARHLSRPMALAALDAFTHAELATVAALTAGLGPLKGFRGIVQARDLVALVEPSTESPGESWLRLRIIDAGFPRPHAQVVIVDAYGRQVYRIDLGYPGLRLGFEYDGQTFHDSDEQRAHDASRRDELARRFDWSVYGFGRAEVLGREPKVELVIGELIGREPLLPRRW